MTSKVDKIKKFLKYWKFYAAILLPFIFAALFLFSTSKETRCGYVILVMVSYWITEVIPLGVTALIPVLAFPLLGILSSSVVCSAYMKEPLLFFLGAFLLAVAIEDCNLNKRIALFSILRVGQSPRKLLLGFMLTTMFLSIWLSNSVCTAMMIPIVDGVLKELYKTIKLKDLEYTNKDDRIAKEDVEEEILTVKYSPQTFSRICDENICNSEEYNSFRHLEITGENVNETPKGILKTSKSVNYKTLKTMYLLGVAYSANIGGTGSLIGAIPNLILKGFLDTSFDRPTGLNFGTWVAFNLPGVVLCTLCGFIWLQYLFIGFGSKSKLPQTTKENKEKIKQYLKAQYKSLGKISFHESAVLVISMTLIILWLFRDPGFIPGWAQVVKMYFPDITIGDSVPAILGALLLFIIPSEPNFWTSIKYRDGPSKNCLTWKRANEKIHWNVILILGGGFAMAKACNDSGLSVFAGEKLKFIYSLSPSLSVLVISTVTTFITEVCSNAVTALILMPIIKEMALKMCVNPLYLMLPAGVCCSYAFMFPFATPPNTIIYGAAGGDMKTSEMMKAGIVMNIICIVIINVMINTLGVAMFNVGELPSWVNSTSTQDYFQECLMNSTLIDL